MLFYIKDEDYKPPNIPFPPGSHNLNAASSAHFKVDPKFLSTSSVKLLNTRLDKSGTPLVKHARLDKTGTPLVKHTGTDKTSTPLIKHVGPDETGTPLVNLPVTKPTGVVQPSPQKDVTKSPDTTKGQSLSPPATRGAAVTPKMKSVSPPNVGGGSSGRETSPMMREFSIPLRKISSATPTKVPSSEKTEVVTKNVSSQQQLTTPTTTTTATAAPFRFTPRQISAPPKPKKQQKVAATLSSVTLKQESEKTLGDGKMGGAISTQPAIEVASSITGQSVSSKAEEKEGNTILDYATEAKAAPSFKAIQSGDASQAFIGPMLPPSSSSSLPQSPLRMTPFSLRAPTSAVSPKVALVQPQPQVRGKPVARVLPNPHVQEGRGEEETTPRAEGQAAVTPGPPMNAVSPWKVKEAASDEAFGPTLPEGLEYNSSAHGWNVSAISGGEEGQHHGKAKKHKKKKKHRKREDDGSSESEGERGGKRDRSKKESKRTKGREVSHSPERAHRHRSHSPVERGSHRDPRHSPERAVHHHHSSAHKSPERTPHYDKYRKHRRHSHRNRDRGMSESSRRHRHKASHHSHHDRSRSSSRSRSRSPLNVGSKERRYHKERHWTPPGRHTHHHAPLESGHTHHHTPLESGHTHHHTPLDSVGEGHRKTKGSHHYRQQSEHPHHRVKHVSDCDDKRVKSEDKRRERKRSHHHDDEHCHGGLGEKEHEHKKLKTAGTCITT